MRFNFSAFSRFLLL